MFRMAKGCAVVFLMLLAAGCAQSPELDPAPRATTTAGAGEGAAASDAGVRIEARSGVWDATPTDLPEKLTPVRVTVENESGRPLRIRFKEFALVAPDGDTHAALPPFDIEKAVTRPVTTPAFPSFTVAPHLSPHYPGWPAFTGMFAHDRAYYGDYGPATRRVGLPSRAMVENALPEGVLDSGGSVSGFLYFEQVAPEDREVVFRTELVDAESEEQYGAVTIPFRVETGT